MLPTLFTYLFVYNLVIGIYLNYPLVVYIYFGVFINIEIY